MLATFLRIVFFLLVFWGVCLALTDGAGVQPEMAPALACSGISSLMVAAGVLNILPLMLKLLTLLGIAAAVYFGWRRLHRGFTGREIAIAGLWLAAVGLFLLLARGQRLTNYDNFSHWAMVVKAISRNDRLPNFQDTTILFQAYPVGTAVFLYFVQHFVGNTESLLLWGQFLLNASFLLPLTAFARKKNAVLWAGIAVYALFALSYNVSCYDLTVDTVMPLAGVALLCVLYIGRDSGASQKRTALEALPLALFLVNVKNSGVFFVITAAVFFLVLNRSNIRRNPRYAAPYGIYGLALPLVQMYLWERHVAFAFAQGTVSKHALSVENYAQVYAEKSSEEIRQIASLVGQRIFSTAEPLNRVFLLLVAMLLVLGLCARCSGCSAREPWGLVAAALGIYGAYLALVLAMYIFSMPTEEALMLGSFSRYVRTVLIYLWGLGVIAALRLGSPAKSPAQAAVAVLCGLSLCFCPSGLKGLFCPQPYAQSERFAFQSLLEGYDLSYTERYVLYSNDKDAGYLYHLACYELWTTDVQMCSADTFADMQGQLDQYDWVIVWSDDDTIQQYMDERGITGRVFRPQRSTIEASQ